MYDYHYEVMQKHYGDKIDLMYTDTGNIYIFICNYVYYKTTFIHIIFILDSLVYHIFTDDFYEDLLNYPILLNRLDTANLPQDHPCYIAERRKVPGYFSDETNGLIMTAFCALRAKSYAYKIEGRGAIQPKEEIRAKGIRRHVVDNHMTFEDHRRCLFGEPGLEVYKHNISIRSFNHQLMTLNTKKLSYNNYDDKRVILDDKIHTLAHGHYRIE